MTQTIEKIKRDILERIQSQEISEAFKDKFYDEYAHDLVADMCDKMHQLSGVIAVELLDIITQMIESGRTTGGTANV